MGFLARLLGRKEQQIQPPFVSNTTHGERAVKPAIKLFMMGGNIFSSALNGEPMTGIAIDARVWNVGNPAAIVRWRLEIIPIDTPFSCDLSEIPDTLTLNGPVQTVIHGADALDKRVGVQLVGAAPFQGRLLFYSELPQATVMSPNTRLRLIAEDVYGTEYKTEQLMGAWNRQGAPR